MSDGSGSHDLRDVVLVGHSYGGVVTSLLAERERARIRQLVYLDAFVPEPGKRVVDYLLPLERREAIVKLGSQTGYVPPVPAPALGVTDPADLAWVNPRVVPQPFATFNEPTPACRAPTWLASNLPVGRRSGNLPTGSATIRAGSSGSCAQDTTPW